MNLIEYLNRPEYIFRPIQVYRRLLRPVRSITNECEDVILPWGAQIRIRPGEVIGRSISIMGLYDLGISELIWRLLEPGETAIDVGANIGYITSIMAKKLGNQGKILCFEPLPEIYEELIVNIKCWQNELGWNQIIAKKTALSNKTGQGTLYLSSDFKENRGTASLASPKNEMLEACSVDLVRLDELVTDSEPIGLMKIDVEGHELEVLQGANNLVAQQKVRDIVFEEHHSYPSPVTQFLEERGYTVFRIKKGFWKPLLKAPIEQQVPHPWEPPNYLATKEPSRAISRMKNKGWSLLF